MYFVLKMPSKDTRTAVILAAGLGKRMRSKTPKALQPLVGKPMVRYVLDAALSALPKRGPKRCVVVVGHGAAQVKAALGDAVEYAHQAKQLGTGHALAQAKSLAKDASHILVLNADIPLISSDTIAGLIARHVSEEPALTFLTANVEDARGLGRVQRDKKGRVTGVIEEADADQSARATTEVNVGVYCFRGDWLWPHLARVSKSAAGEYYLTDLISMAIGEGAPVMAMPTEDQNEGMGINDRVQLAQADGILRDRIRKLHMLGGVTLVDPASVYIDADVVIGQDSTIYPNTMLLGQTRIGQDCAIGPNSQIVDSRLGAGCRVSSSVIKEATLEDSVDVGPFSHIRSGSYICQGVHIGNYAEVKNSRLGRNTKMGHFSYIGDADVGDDVNIGAGTITCNYDGVRKHRTVIGDGAFIGSDTMLVAPVEVGARAKTGAGSVVNHNVPADRLAVGMPARIRHKKGD